MGKAKVEIPPDLIPVFTGPARYRAAHGGRGSGKTRTFAKMSAIRGYMAAEAGRSGVILCGREYMNSLEDSSLEEVKTAILSEPWLANYYDVGEKYVRSRNGRIKYRFTGLRKSLESVKSKANVLIAWVDEAEYVSEAAWRKLGPTVRGKDSEIWVTWNPENPASPTDIRFRQNRPRNSKIAEINFQHNPWFPPELEEERLNDLDRLDTGTYAHIWEGEYLEISNSLILADKVKVKEFKPAQEWDGPYYGADWGFAQDPTAAVRCWVHDNTLYIEHEGGKVGLDIDKTAEFLIGQLPDIAKHTIRADSARPETISYVKRNGLPGCISVDKWPGSVQDGIAHLRGYKNIVVHPRCKETVRETRLYSYKVDRLTGDVMPIVVDAYNHYIDAIRYALAPLIQRKNANVSGYQVNGL